MTHTTTLTETSLKTFLSDYASYNAWANRRLAEWLRGKPSAELEQPVPSSFPGLRATLHHILFVERNWLNALQSLPGSRAYGQPYEGSNEQLLDELLSVSDALRDDVRALTDAEVQASCRFQVPVRWPEWDDFDRPRHEVMLHVFSHSAYHRGQLTSMGRQLGYTDAPMTDFMYYNLLGR